MSHRRPAALVALGLLAGVLLAGCGLDQGDADDAFDGNEAVTGSHVGCDLGSCFLQVDLAADATAEGVARALAAARELDPKEMTLTFADPDGTAEEDERWVRAELEPESDGTDGALARALVWGRDQPTLERFVVEGRDSGVVVEATPAADADLWTVAENAWAALDELPSPFLDVARLGRDHGPDPDRKVTVDGELPAAGLRVARDLERTHGGPRGAGLTGLVVSAELVVVGVTGPEAAAAVRRTLDGRTAQAGEPAVEVAVTDEVFALAHQPSERREAAAGLVDLLAGEPTVVSARADQRGVEVLLAGGLDRAVPLAALVRREAARELAAARITFRTLEDSSAEVVHDGDDALLRLGAEALATAPDGSRVEISQEEGRPPSLSLRVPVPAEELDLAPHVSRLAAAVAAHRGEAPTLALGVAVEDPEGRGADAGWEVTLGPHGPVITEVRGTEETQAEVRRAWQDGLAPPAST